MNAVTNTLGFAHRRGETPMQPCVQMFTRTRGSNPATVGRQRVDLLPCHSERERSLPQHTLTIMDLTNVSGLPAVSHIGMRNKQFFKLLQAHQLSRRYASVRWSLRNRLSLLAQPCN